MAIPFFKRDPDIELPPLPATATVARPNGKMDLPDMDRQWLETIERVGDYAPQLAKKLHELQIQLTESVLRGESARREIDELRVQIAQRDNNYQVLQSHSEERIRAIQSQSDARLEEALNMRATLSNIFQLLVSRIPLPSDQSKEVAHVSGPTPVDRPASTADSGAGQADPAA